MWASGGIKARVDWHLRDARAAMPPRLRASFDRLLAQRGWLSGEQAPYFGTMSHPLFELPVWVAERQRSGGCPVTDDDLSRALGVSALGYLHARTRDDWLDGGVRDDPHLVALGDVLLARCTRLLGEVAGDSPRFWARYDEAVALAAEALLRAEEARRSRAAANRETFEQALDQSRPLVLPSLALLDRAGRWDLAPALEEFVFAAAATSQVYDDLLDAYGDRDTGQRTWVVETFEAAGDGALAGALLCGPHAGAPDPVRQAVRLALDYHERAARAAAALGLDAAVRWLARRREELDGTEAALRAAVAEAFTRRIAAGPPGTPGPRGQDTTRKEATAWEATT